MDEHADREEGQKLLTFQIQNDFPWKGNEWGKNSLLSNTSTNNDDSSNFDLNMCHQATKDKNWDRVMITEIFYGTIQIISGSKKQKRFNITFFVNFIF